MKLFRYGVLPLLFLALSGCSSTPTQVNKGTVKATTFNFVNNGAVAPANFTENRAAVHSMIQNAITKELEKKGVRRVESGGDVTIAYLIILANNVSTTSINDYFGYGRDASALSDKAHKAATGGKNPNYFEAGTLVIDVINSKTFELLERSHITRPLLGKATEEIRETRIQEAVEATLANTRFASGK